MLIDAFLARNRDLLDPQVCHSCETAKPGFHTVQLHNDPASFAPSRAIFVPAHITQQNWFWL